MDSWKAGKDSRYPISFVQSDPSNTRCETTNPTVRDEKGGKDTMEVPTKHIISSYEDDSLSDTSSPEEEKTIPFLRRLRDMLVENHEVISFAPGSRTSSPPVLGRIIVHDRVEVEGKVLPRYFNHSSFASLRRQLNYFSFIRLGKGRQRESTYINENVVELDDILHLKRRSASGQLVQPAPPKQELVSGISTVYDRDISHEKLENKAHIRTCSMDNSEASLEQPHKRRRHSAPTTVSPRSTSPVESYSMSEEDESSHVALDLTLPESQRDEDFMMGCKNLLCLSSKRWD